MKHTFDDITSRIKEEPSWFDANGTPRYGKFEPDACPNIYAKEVLLMDIGCQNCHKRFLVEQHFAGFFDSQSLSDALHKYKQRTRGVNDMAPLHYGDPPAHGCTGDTMNCDDFGVIEFWKKSDFEWVRVKRLEIRFDP